MQDAFNHLAASMIDPAGRVFLITPDDDTDLAFVTRAISFAAAGTLHIVTAAGQEVTIPDGALAAGVMHPLRVTKVFEADTGATGIVGYA